MRRNILWLLSTLTGLVLLLSYRTSTMGADPGAAAHAAAPPTGDGFDGSVAHTRWGDVQVRITVDGGRITDVQVLTHPDGNRRDQQINDYALPILHDEAIAAQSADIDTVSGATVTSDGYRESLQAAIDAAHL
ncbi:FMN-binding protein [Catellatospora tritici]|uniref:FMN-binding protein n=1 Tax=Catellatospora tritici TaxID=2851566 RepID=UPI001C2CE447|nr:FMN-binding protein [Catellatospora tritici]MBV1853920.1 FMN-binding protein [Catellatospora tritici]